jgi:alcohol dehydrogenase
MALYEMRKFVAPEFIFGVGARKRVAYYARNMMARRVFLVSDPGVIAAGWMQDVRDELTEAGIDSVLFKDVSPNPRDYEVMAGAALFARERCDVIVAVGGGSAIDCAKAIGIVHANGCDVREMEGADQVEMPGPPLICIPTTAGTAADISQFCIIVNSPERYKMAIVSKTVVPDVALVDPECTLTMDPYLTACTGVDALTHAIEAFRVDGQFAGRRRACAGGDQARLEQPRAGRRRAARPGGAREHAARQPAGRAGFLECEPRRGARAGAFLGGYLDLPHGECNALLLEHVVRFNITEAPSAMRRSARRSASTCAA